MLTTFLGHLLPTTWLTMEPRPPNGACSSTVTTAFALGSRLDDGFFIQRLDAVHIYNRCADSLFLKKGRRFYRRLYHLSAGNDRYIRSFRHDGCLIHCKRNVAFLIDVIHSVSSNPDIGRLIIRAIP